MKTTIKLLSVLLVSLLISCGGKEEKKEQITLQKKAATSIKKQAISDVPASKKIDLTNRGVGLIKTIELSGNINNEMASKGSELFKSNCTACHRPLKKFIGPAPVNILERRTPEWIMNMILDPEKMVKEDPLARELLIEFNGSPMANQSLSEEEARAILEYFRTLTDNN
jgi:mono/diheme cytochrome c family protein